MGSEAVLVCFDTNEVYELGKFAGSWLNDELGEWWTRTDLKTLEARVAHATIDEERAYMSPEHPELAKARGIAAEIFAFCERVDWKVECLDEQDPRYEERLWARRLRVIGNRYDARPKGA